jgi:hypothetical protein
MKKMMIRIAAAFAACTMTVSAVSATATAAETEPAAKYLLGDVSMDGKIDLDDVILIADQCCLSFTLGLTHETDVAGVLFTETQNILGDICGNDYQPKDLYPNYMSDFGLVDTRVSLYDVLAIIDYYTQKELLSNTDYTWAEFGKFTYADGTTFLDRMMSVDRGDYELRWDDAFGDYVVALK